MTHLGSLARTLGVGMVAVCLWLPGGQAEAADAWEWTLIPYMWASSISIDVEIDDEPVVGGEIDFRDLLDKVEFVLPLHFEGRRGKGGFLLDLLYIDLGDSQTTSGGSGPPDPPDGTQIDSDLKMALFEAGGFYRPKGRKGGLDVLGGVRVIDVDQTNVITLPTGEPPTTDETSATFTDGFVGLRYAGRIGGKWKFSVRGDIGAGDTDLALNGIALVGYEFGKKGKYSVLFGWRYMGLEFEDDDDGARIETELTMSGPLAGFRIVFGGS